MTVERLPDWPARLSAYLSEAKSRPFVWGGDGGHDCVLFSLGAAEAQTGGDYTSQLRGKYKSALGAAKKMRSLFGAKNLPEAAEAFRAFWSGTEVSVRMAQRGSIVLADVNTPEGISEALGVVDMDGKTALFAGPHGLTRIPLKYCKRAWGLN